MGTVLGWLGYQVGFRTDTADAAGSLHAKLALLNGDITGLFGSLRPGTSDITISSNTSWAYGVYRYNNFTVNAGVTLSASDMGFIVIANNITVNGLITASGKGGSGGAYVTTNTAGSPANGKPGADITSMGSAGGGGGSIDYYGSSGASGNEATGGRGGNTGVAAGGYSNTSGLYNGTVGGNGAGVVTNLPWLEAFTTPVLCGTGGGSGGAGTATSGQAATSGAGGAGGGFLVLVARKITIASGGAVRADGLAGGNATAASGAGAGGGGGGGGGTIIPSCAELINSGTISASGGAGGTGTGSIGTDWYYGNGGSGGNGVVLISYW